ncbi:MAG: hypothetical protein LBI31_01010, partial [Zoogloeaceae bacterium]|jgi:hypothetical protein|nr:hypothetical protein [Zoogloeaceae bacterium]
VLARGGYTLSDIRAFTDMYITAKENGLDVSQVWGLANQKAIFAEPGITWLRADSIPDGVFSESTLDWAKELRGRVAESGFFGVGKTVFDYTLDPYLALGILADGIDYDTATRARLYFLTSLLDLIDAGKYYNSFSSSHSYSSPIDKTDDESAPSLNFSRA